MQLTSDSDIEVHEVTDRGESQSHLEAREEMKTRRVSLEILPSSSRHDEKRPKTHNDGSREKDGSSTDSIDKEPAVTRGGRNEGQRREEEESLLMKREGTYVGIVLRT